MQVAKLAGIPAAVIKAAQSKLAGLEKSAPQVNSSPSVAPAQPDMFAVADDHPAVESLKDINPDELSPREALDALYAMKKMLDQ